VRGCALSEQVSEVVTRAQSALESWWGAAPEDRAKVLESIANALDAHAEELAALANEETFLGEPRLVGEVARTTFQLRMFARGLRDGDILDSQIDPAVAGPPPAGHPTLRRTAVPIGVVAVFGASNFPFAFGVLGGDTASALAAGCAVIVKIHPAHPRLSHRLVDLAREALAGSQAPADLVTSVEGIQEGADLVVAPGVSAVGFTGSKSVGRLLFDLASTRPDPIAFYGELSSVNPVVVTPQAARERPDEIAQGFVDSLTLGAGQFCTKPALLLAPRSAAIGDKARRLAAGMPGMTLLTEDITSRFTSAIERLSVDERVKVSSSGRAPEGGVAATIIETEIADFLAPDSAVREECFGPSAVVLPYDEIHDALRVLAADEGILVGCVHGEEGEDAALVFLRTLARRAGRVVWNGWPTGLAVSAVQMHGGPWPASTASVHTSVGLQAVYRFARPVAFQDVPEGMDIGV